MSDERIWSEQEEPEPLGRTRLLSELVDVDMRYPSSTQVPPAYRKRLISEVKPMFDALLQKTEWQYMVVDPVDHLGEDYSRQDLNDLLDGYGADGWCLSTLPGQTWYVFIRPKRGDS